MQEEVDWVEELAKKVIGAALEVHSILGPGFAESVYEEALAKEFEIRHVPFERQKSIGLSYKEYYVGDYRLDFLVDKQLVIELKSVDCLSTIHTAQTLSYLKATGLGLGLLINFNVAKIMMGINRVILSKPQNALR